MTSPNKEHSYTAGSILSDLDPIVRAQFAEERTLQDEHKLIQDLKQFQWATDIELFSLQFERAILSTSFESNNLNWQAKCHMLTCIGKEYSEVLV